RRARLVLCPAIGPQKIEVGLPAKAVVGGARTARHAVCVDERSVAVVQLVAEAVEVAAVGCLDAGGARGRAAVAAAVGGDDVGVLFVAKRPLGERCDSGPHALLA